MGVTTLPLAVEGSEVMNLSNSNVAVDTTATFASTTTLTGTATFNGNVVINRSLTHSITIEEGWSSDQ